MHRCCLTAITLVILLAGLPAPAPAATHVARVPLREGMLHSDDLLNLLSQQMNLEIDCPIKGEIDLSSLRGSLFIRALNRSLGEGCRLSVEPDALVLQFDPDKLPKNSTQARKALRTFTAVAAPDATGDQARLYGLLLPVDLDETRPLVILVHGLDCTKAQWWNMASLLQEDGHQVGYFTFPSDQPLVDSAGLLGRHMEALHETFPRLKVSILTYSMGALVARGYIEGPDYRAPVDRLIMIAPPNHGSKWARYRTVLEVHEHWNLWRSNSDWHWTWPITDGLGEAGDDLRPKSSFLDQLNAYPRRAGVAYTIIAGNQHTARRLVANWVETPARWAPHAVQNWWGVRQSRAWLQQAADEVRSGQDRSDGPVTLKSAHLPGVDDFVLLPADHNSLYQSTHGQPPAAWPIIRDRLSR